MNTNYLRYFTLLLFFSFTLAAVSLNNKGDLLLNSLLQGDIVLSSNSDIIFEHKSEKTNLVRLLNVLDSVAGNICFLTPPNPPPSWESLPTLPEPLYGFGIALVDSSLIYVVGGLTAINSTSNKVYVLDTNNMTWSEKASMDAKRAYPYVATNSLGTKLYVFGGYDLDTAQEVRSVAIYDILSNSWQTTSIQIEQNFYHLGSSVVVGDTIYFFGGLSSPEAYNSLYRGIFTVGADINGTVSSFNMEYNAWNYSIPSMPTPRFQATAFTINNRVYVAGGRDSQFDSSVLDIYDISSNSWLAPTELPGLPLSQSASVVSSSLGFVLGGYSGILQQENSLVSSTMTFNSRTSRWRTDIFPSLTFSRANHRVVALDGYIYVIGGQSNTTVVSTVERILPCF